MTIGSALNTGRQINLTINNLLKMRFKVYLYPLTYQHPTIDK